MIKKSESEILKERLRALHFFTYRQYLRSKLWYNFKIKYLKSHRRRCSICFSKYRLNLHHNTYIRLGKERETDVNLLCFVCHKKEHKLPIKPKFKKRKKSLYRKYCKIR